VERHRGAPMSDDFWAIWNERREYMYLAVSPDLLQMGNDKRRDSVINVAIIATAL
jgi:hypothetical protein